MPAAVCRAATICRYEHAASHFRASPQRWSPCKPDRKATAGLTSRLVAATSRPEKIALIEPLAKLEL